MEIVKINSPATYLSIFFSTDTSHGYAETAKPVFNDIFGPPFSCNRKLKLCMSTNFETFERRSTVKTIGISFLVIYLFDYEKALFMLVPKIRRKMIAGCLLPAFEWSMYCVVAERTKHSNDHNDSGSTFS